MLSDKFTQKQGWMIFLVTIYVFALLLPANTVRAATPAQDCHKYDGGSQAATVAAIAVPAADQQVTIPKEEVAKAVFLAKWLTLPNATIVESLVFNQFLYHMDKMPADFDNEDLSQFRQAYQQSIEKYMQGLPEAERTNAIVHTILNLALDRPELAPSVPFVWRQLMSFVTDDYHKVDQLVGQSAQRYNLGQQLLYNSAEVVTKIYECAHKFPEVAKAFDYHYNLQFGGSILDDSITILEANLDLEVPDEIKGWIGDDGTISISVDEIQAITEIQLGKIHTSIDKMQETLSQIDEQQKVIIDYIQDQELKAKHQELAKKIAAEEQRNLDAAKASITIISTLLNQIDPKLGKQLSVVSASTLQVGMALNGWLKSVSGLNGLDKIASLSTVVMTGNVLGAIMNVMTLFGEDKPTPEQMILEEIGKLRQQVDKLRTEMHGRFDRIDAGLNNIYTTMVERFDQVDIQLGKINGKLDEVQRSLVELDLKLSRIEHNNFEMLNALGRRPLLEAINGGLNFLETTGSEMPYTPQFIEFANLFYTWGTLHAFDALEAGPSQTDYSDANVLAVLNAYGTDSNINYFNGWLTAHGLPGIANKRLASPRDWLLASRAFTQLGIEWPDHMGRYDAQRQDDLDKVGADIEKAMLNISTMATASGPQGNHLLFTNVITNYQDKLDLLVTKLESEIETPFVMEVLGDRLQQSGPFDLFGGIEQPLSYESPSVSIISCGPFATLDAPSNLKTLIPDYELYKLAEYLQVDAFSSCADASLQNPEEVCLPKLEVCQTRGFLRLRISVSFGSTELFSRLIVLGSVLLGPDDGEDPINYVTTKWLEIKQDFEGNNTPDNPNAQEVEQRAALLAKTMEDIYQRFFTLQQELYGRVLNALTNGSLNLLTVELAGSKALLDRFVTLGLSRAVTEDEFFHAMLFGNQQLVEGAQIVQTYSISYTQPITNINIMMNPRVLIKQTASNRLTEFRKLITEYLDAITAGEHVAGVDYIGDLRQTLDLMTRIVHVELLEPSEVAIAGLQATSDGPTLLGNATNFVASVTAGTNISYTWDFGDGNAGSGAAPSHSFAQAGNYVVQVTAANSLGQSADEAVVQVHAPNPNEVAIAGLTVTYDAPTTLGETTSFTASVTAGTNVSYAWDFGDGNVGIGPNTTHAYAEPGLYAVEVKASNSANQTSAQMQVEVKPLGSGQATQQIYLPSLGR